MDRSYLLIISALLCTIILAAGCTQNTGTTAQVTPTATPSVPVLSSLALTASEVPEGFVLNYSITKQSVSKFASDLGWQGGYAISFAEPARDASSTTDILQSIAIYPAQNIPEILSYAIRGEQSDTDMTFTDLQSPGIGDNSNAFSAKVNGQTAVKPTDNPLLTGNIKPVTPALKQDYVEIVFSRGNTFEVLRMSGPGANYTVLKGLAETAYRKIP